VDPQRKVTFPRVPAWCSLHRTALSLTHKRGMVAMWGNNTGVQGSFGVDGEKKRSQGNSKMDILVLSWVIPPHESQLLSPSAATTEAREPRACAPQQEKPLQRESRTPQRRVTPAHQNSRKSSCSNEDPVQPK